MEKEKLQAIVSFIKGLYPDQLPVPLHAPVFKGNEKKYLTECIDSTFVSYVGKYVTQFEKMTVEYTGAKYAVAVVNGTSALQIALQIAGVEKGDEVITQALTFVATSNAISHCGATPVFLDVDRHTLGLSPVALREWLAANTELRERKTETGENEVCCFNTNTLQKIAAIVPMHTFGHPCQIEEIIKLGKEYHINVIEDAAESLGSFYKGKHTGTFGQIGILSYNGNKTITTGGGGMVITDDENMARRAIHITTTAKIPHRWEYAHDEIAYNYRLTNVNAAIGVAQMEMLPRYLMDKRQTAIDYAQFFKKIGVHFVLEPDNGVSNYWLNAIVLENRAVRNEFLEESNSNGVMTRPIWNLMHTLPMYANCQHDDLVNSKWLESRVVNIPSGVRYLKIDE